MKHKFKKNKNKKQQNKLGYLSRTTEKLQNIFPSKQTTTGHTGQTFPNKQTSSNHNTNTMDVMMDASEIKKVRMAAEKETIKKTNQ